MLYIYLVVCKSGIKFNLSLIYGLLKFAIIFIDLKLLLECCNRKCNTNNANSINIFIRNDEVKYATYNTQKT